MKSKACIVTLLFLLTTSAIAQDVWSPPFPLTSGPFNDGNPVFATRMEFFHTQDWLAFTRVNPATGISSIGVASLSDSFGTRIDSVNWIFDDSTGTNDALTLAEGVGMKLLLWHRHA